MHHQLCLVFKMKVDGTTGESSISTRLLDNGTEVMNPLIYHYYHVACIWVWVLVQYSWYPVCGDHSRIFVLDVKDSSATYNQKGYIILR